MVSGLTRFATLVALTITLGVGASAQAKKTKTIELTPLGTYSAGLFDKGGALINVYDPDTQRLFIVNAGDHRIDIVDVGDPIAPLLVGTIDITSIGANPLSVAIHDGLLAVSIEAFVRQDPVVEFGNDLLRHAIAPLENWRPQSLPEDFIGEAQ